MAYTAETLITNAWYLSGIVARDLEVISGSQIEDGLTMLNSVLAIKSFNDRLIPYYQDYPFTLTQNVEKYFIPNLIEIEVFDFYINDVRFSTIKEGRKKYKGSARVENLLSLPFQWYGQRTQGGMDLFVYALPVQSYNALINGKFALTSVTLTQDLSLTYDLFYIEYLRYALAEYMCSEYNIVFQPQNAQKLREYEFSLMDVQSEDLHMQKFSTLNAHTGLSWGYINLGRGWTS